MSPGARQLGSLLAMLTAAILVLVSGAAPVAASGGSSGNAGSGGCDPYVDGTVIPVPCSSSSDGGGDGTGASGAGSTVNSSCTTTVLDMGQAKGLGLPWPPPAGESWALLACLEVTTGTIVQAVLVSNATGAPAITPQQLLVTALGELRVPYLSPGTAPPRGHDGLVGLPEWFWIRAGDWHRREVTVSAGPVWATVTAVPIGLAFDPGAGLSPVSCAGPGTAYNPHRPATAQHTDCSYVYVQPSAGQPGNSYQASVTVTWRVSWTGSGAAGGVLSGALPVTVDFAVPVAQGEALVTSP
jgi:hypothetical protein